MGALAGFTERAGPLVADLEPFAAVASRFTGPFAGFLREFNPFQAYIAPYARDIGGIIAGNRAGSEPTDALGHYSRVVPLISKSSAFGVLTPDQETALEALSHAGILSAVDTRGHNAYPPPGHADDPIAFDGTYPRVTRDPPYAR
jgi:phospholipid/cholesterol/gamma-HCH transport system substrate-binding protein